MGEPKAPDVHWLKNPPFYRKYTLQSQREDVPDQGWINHRNQLLLANIGKLISDKGIMADTGQWIDCDFTGFAKMTYTDYHVKSEEYRTNRIYSTSIKQECQPYLNHYASLWGCRNFNVQGIWFAQYQDGAEFGWHTHEGCNASAIYMVELPGGNTGGTEFHGINWKETLAEGDLFCFPAMVPHRSPTINVGRKTIIGLNGNINNCPSNLHELEGKNGRRKN